MSLLEEALRVRRLLNERRSLAWVASHESLDEGELREALRDPAVRRHYAWPEYSPVTGEIRFNAARFDHAAVQHLTVLELEPAGRVRSPDWRH